MHSAELNNIIYAACCFWGDGAPFKREDRLIFCIPSMNVDITPQEPLALMMQKHFNTNTSARLVNPEVIRFACAWFQYRGSLFTEMSEADNLARFTQVVKTLQKHTWSAPILQKWWEEKTKLTKGDF